MAYKIDTKVCLKCGLCISKCPEEAIIPLKKVQVDELVLQAVKIDAAKCNDCGLCPARAIKKV